MILNLPHWIKKCFLELNDAFLRNKGGDEIEIIKLLGILLKIDMLFILI